MSERNYAHVNVFVDLPALFVQRKLVVRLLEHVEPQELDDVDGLLTMLERMLEQGGYAFTCQECGAFVRAGREGQAVGICPQCHALNELDKQLDSGIITEEEYNRQVAQAVKGGPHD